MCACVRMTASSGPAVHGCQFRRRSSLRPWKRPASIRMRLPDAVVSRCRDPVTVCAAPRNMSVATARHSAISAAAVPCRSFQRAGSHIWYLPGHVRTRVQIAPSLRYTERKYPRGTTTMDYMVEVVACDEALTFLRELGIAHTEEDLEQWNVGR